MGNCFGLHAIRCANGLWTSHNSSHVTTRKSSENGGGITRKSPQAQQNKDKPDEVSCKTPAIGAPGFMAEVGNSTNYLHAFTYSELKSATRNFRPDSLLGKGGFGSVFKGNIHERTFQTVGAGQGILIAVKKLNSDGYQGHREWLAELKYLGTLKHPNLVKLIGYCCEDEHRLLVYEFMNRGSLEHHLFGRKNQTVSWSTRLKIAVDAARGLTFLHDAEKPVIYRDFKTSNILLDSDFNAKLSDFGLAKDGPTGNKTHVTTRILGTYGYVAPEYVATGHLTAKSDVYGFGVVLLEILTGKRAVSTDKSGEEQKLVEWAMPYLTDKRKWTRVLDQSLDGQYSLKGAQHAANIALHCLSQDPRRRPTMKMVLEALEPLLNPKAEPKNSSFLLTSDETKSPTSRETPSIPRPKPNPSKHAHAASRQAQALAFHPRPANAFRLPSPLPSPQQIACKQSSHTIAPSQSPARVSPIVQP